MVGIRTSPNKTKAGLKSEPTNKVYNHLTQSRKERKERQFGFNRLTQHTPGVSLCLGDFVADLCFAISLKKQTEIEKIQPFPC